jgi:ubiquinone/menaquinone biosynthesis C-methylase UbiE
MEPAATPTDRQKFARSYWDGRAKKDAHYAIWGDPAVIDGAAPDVDAFDRSGQHEALELLPWVHPEATVVELGCGIGRLLRPVSRHAKRAIGIDVSAEMVERSKEYLADSPNAHAIVGDGASLTGIADESVDFLYSKLCLIHVDKRSAYRYLREIRRVLRPDGRALLQFQDITSPRGLELFQSVVASDYPFEFYTPEELGVLLRSVDLEIHGEHRYQEFVEMSVGRGPFDAWVREWRESVEVTRLERGGFFAGTAGESRIDAAIANRSTSWRTCQVTGSVVRRTTATLHEHAFTGAIVFLPPRSSVSLAIERQDDTGELAIVTGARHVDLPSRLAEVPPRRGKLECHVALIPSGVRWSARALQDFPDSGVVWPLQD